MLVAARSSRRALTWLALTAALLPVPPAAAQAGSTTLQPTSPSAIAPLSTEPKSLCPEPHIELAPVRGGRTRIDIDSSCRANELVMFNYAGVIFMRWLDALGHTEFILDCFAGNR